MSSKLRMMSADNCRPQLLVREFEQAEMPGGIRIRLHYAFSPRLSVAELRTNTKRM